MKGDWGGVYFTSEDAKMFGMKNPTADSGTVDSIESDRAAILSDIIDRAIIALACERDTLELRIESALEILQKGV